MLLYSYNYRYHAKKGLNREIVKATLFLASLLILLFGSLIVAAINSGPIILGTERNTDGLVEYMCLGNGCENLTDFRWQD